MSIPLIKSHLSEIKAGMFWYADNTVSGKLITNKPLKSIVLYVKSNQVFGDSFIEIKECNREDAQEHFCNLSKQHLEKNLLHYFTQEEFVEVAKKLDTINKSIRLINGKIWENFYWTSSEKNSQTKSNNNKIINFLYQTYTLVTGSFIKKRKNPMYWIIYLSELSNQHFIQCQLVDHRCNAKLRPAIVYHIT